MDKSEIITAEPEVTVDAAEVAEQEVAQATEKEEKQFTQADLDKIIEDRLKRERSKQPKKEELEAFKKWKEDQKIAEERMSEALNTAKAEAEAAKAELTALRQTETVRKSNVDEKFVDFVNFETARLAKAKDIDFNEALTVFLKTNTSYTKQAELPKKETRDVTVSTGANNTPPITAPKLGLFFPGVRPKPTNN